MVSATKDPTKVRAGTIGASTRWGPVRRLRLDELTPEQRTVIAGLVEAQAIANRMRAAAHAAATKEAAPVCDDSGTALAEVHGNARSAA